MHMLIYLLAWLFVVFKFYAFFVLVFNLPTFLLMRVKFKEALLASLKLYALRPWSKSAEQFYRLHTRASRIEELDEEDIAYLEAHKEVAAMLEEKAVPRLEEKNKQ